MTRTLLCGPAGSGKTRRVLDEVAALVGAEGASRDGGAERRARFQVLVPTYSQAEHLKRKLLAHLGTGALLDRGVGTFEQLAERRTGIRLSSLVPGAVRDALLADAFAEADLPEFRRVATFPGLRRAALRLLEELKASEHEPGEDALAAASERLGAAAESFTPERAARTRGLLRVLRIYEDRLRTERLLDHGDLLRALLAAIRESGDEHLDLVALDGFTDLTPVQERIVHALAERADRTIVTLLADGAPRPGTFLAATDRMRRRFAGADYEVEALGAPHRFGGSIARVARRLAGADAASDASDPGDAGNVRLLAGADPDDEADRVARTCLRWSAEGIERSEILVVVRRVDSPTATRVVEALARHGVPARRMGRTPVAQVPWIRSVLRLLSLLAGDEEGAEALDALRAGDARGVPDREADLLSAAARTMTSRTSADLAAKAAALSLPGAVAWLAELARLRPGAAARPPSVVAAALLAAVPRLLRLPFEGALPAEDEDRLANDAAAARTFRDLVADIVRALRTAGVPETTPSDLVRRIAAASESAGFATNERRGDLVHVVGADEARQWEARAVVVAGMRLGEFPAAAREDLFLSDEERRAAEAATGLSLPPRLDAALERERLLFYFAATRAKDALAFTVPLADETGGPVLPSPFLETVREALPEADRSFDGANRSPGDLRPAPGETLHAEDLDRIALAALSESFTADAASALRPMTGYALLPRLVASPASSVRAAAAWYPLREPALRVDGAARAAMARPRARSASSLSEFSQCAYRHFARKGLALNEQGAAVDDGVDALLAGTIAHEALETAFRDGVRDAAGAERCLDAAWQEHAAHLRTDLRAVALREDLRAAIVELVLREAASPRVPGFRPAHFEWDFGRAGTPTVHAGGPDGVPLVGSVDRIDEGPDGAAIVLDYKWSRHERYRGIHEEIAAGADLQLPIYALAVAQGLRRRPVAAGYLTVRDGKERWLRIAGDAPVDAGTAEQPEGFGEGDGGAGLARAEAHVVEIDRRIRSGTIVLDPRDDERCGAGRCPFADLCRFEGRRA